MVRLIFTICVVSVFAVGGPAVAQQAAVPEDIDLTESGDAYLRALRLRRIDSDVIYFDPSAPPPALDTRAQPEPDPDVSGRSDTTMDTPVVLVAAAILAGLAYMVFRVGGGVSLTFRAPGDADRAGQAASAPEHLHMMAPQVLADILRLSDRRVAVVHLAQTALLASVRSQGGLFQDSWTARDALRHLPPNLPHREALQALVLASERVQFGGRDMAEDEFAGHVARIRPLLQGTGA